jgi:hypothetical protein
MRILIRRPGVKRTGFFFLVEATESRVEATESRGEATESRGGVYGERRLSRKMQLMLWRILKIIFGRTLE